MITAGIDAGRERTGYDGTGHGDDRVNDAWIDAGRERTGYDGRGVEMIGE
jgi:hypothetical protein